MFKLVILRPACVELYLDLPNIPKAGKFYWKMNVSLLDNIDVKNAFQVEWNRLTFMINRYKSINDWWEVCAKKAIKTFFINQGKIENQKKYGFLKYLEFSLNRLYDKNNTSGIIDYDRVRNIKASITKIKAEILEGVKIRSRIDEQLKGETVSRFLIQKQAQIKKKQYITEIISESNVIENLDEGVMY